MNLQARVTNILTKPADEWPVIAGESATVQSLYTEYIVILSAIPAVCKMIGLTLIGTAFFGRVGFATGLMSGCVTYVIGLISCYIGAFIIEKLAPSFGSSGDTAQALKLVAYAYTPVWIAGVLNLVPLLGILTIFAGLYAIYLFYLGMTPVMKTPQDKVIPYMLVSALVIIVVNFVLGMIAASLFVAGAVTSYGM